MTRAARIETDLPVEDDWRRPPWHVSHGTYLAGRAALDGVDAMAIEMEAKWGAGRLRLLVSDDLREKFDRQRYKLNHAISAGELEDVRTEAARMAKAWQVLDRAAEQAGADPVSPKVWEVTLSNGTVAAVVPTNDDAHAVIASGRRMAIYTLEEIGRLLVAWPDIAKVKQIVPGAQVTAVRRGVSDPMHAIDDASRGLDEELPF